MLAQASAGKLAGAFERLDRSGADKELGQLAKGCLAADPAERPADAGALAELVVAYRIGVEERLRAAELERAAAQASAEQARAREVAERRAKRLMGWMALTGTGVILLLGGFFWQRASRQAETERAVSGDLLAADRLQAEGNWGEARSIVERAEGRLASGASERTRLLVRQARADLDMVAKMEQLRLQQLELKGNQFNRAGASSGYAAAFRDHGIDLESQGPEEAADRITGAAIRTRLVEALDDWLSLAPSDDPYREPLRTTLRLVDPDPWREQLRGLQFRKARTAGGGPGVLASWPGGPAAFAVAAASGGVGTATAEPGCLCLARAGCLSVPRWAAGGVTAGRDAGDDGTGAPRPWSFAGGVGGGSGRGAVAVEATGSGGGGKSRTGSGAGGGVFGLLAGPRRRPVRSSAWRR